MEGIFGSMITLENIDTNNVGSVVRKHSADPFTKVHCHVKSMESSFLLALEYNIVDSEVTRVKQTFRSHFTKQNCYHDNCIRPYRTGNTNLKP
mmetsp:Transcript_25677/g.53011  ORF Transcript_25677/g.53011 Transcript_25677/m.53011 type:complete len:93 (+) Transcript_25677:80-358(+)